MKISLVCLALSIALAACSKEAANDNQPAAGESAGEAAAAPAQTAAAAEAKGGQHGAAGAEPGSHEDWCGEHGVPESQCTRCNPDLVAAFKATGDWCAEHGLPESQCKLCNPELEIVRPPPADGAEK